MARFNKISADAGADRQSHADFCPTDTRHFRPRLRDWRNRYAHHPDPEKCVDEGIEEALAVILGFFHATTAFFECTPRGKPSFASLNRLCGGRRLRSVSLHSPKWGGGYPRLDIALRRMTKLAGRRCRLRSHAQILTNCITGSFFCHVAAHQDYYR